MGRSNGFVVSPSIEELQGVILEPSNPTKKISMVFNCDDQGPT